ncbi:MAG: right-handed parallel beta-helix repeat-containing protein [Deltaproteobacteria bacterium]|nr:right-handed parallel beta-helix repeat-containing protein [Deltaproteobacteria bacterium]
MSVVSAQHSRQTTSTLPGACLLPCILAFGCSGGPKPDTDAGDTSTDGTDVAEEFLVSVEPPAPPALPVLTPCPDGWREVEDTETGVVACDPWPETGHEDCGPGEAHFPGEPGCATVGDPCPSGIWPEGLPTDRHVVYVDASASSGGDGTQDTPYSTIIDGLRDTAPESIVALAKGTHEACLRMPPGRTLWGACAAETTVTCPTPEHPSGTIVVLERDVEIRNLTVSGERTGIWVNGPDSSCTIDGVVVSGTQGGGIAVVDICEVIVQNYLARDIRPLTSTGRFGRGIYVAAGGTATVTRAVIERASNMGIFVAEAGSNLTIEDAAVLDTAPSPLLDEGGEGLLVGLDGRIDASRIVFEGNSWAASYASTGTMNLSDCVIRDTASRSGYDDEGHGIVARASSTVNVSRCLVERNRQTGIVYEASIGTLEDIVVRNTLPQEVSDEWGRGLNIQDGSDVTVLRALFHENHDNGIVVGSNTASFTDVTISSTLPRVSDGMFGQGLYVHELATVTGERMLFTGNRNAALVVVGGTATITDLEVMDTLPVESEAIQGLGIIVIYGGSLDLTRASIHDNHEYGLVFEESTGTLQDLWVSNTLARESTGEWGRGLVVQTDSQVQISGAVFSHNREMTVSAFGEGTLLEMEDVEVTDTLFRDCAETTCPDAAAGMGVGAYSGAHIVMTRFFVMNSAVCGLQIAFSQLSDGTSAPIAGSIELHDGEVAHNPIGVNVQDETFDIELLMDNVTYHHNDQNLDSTFLPVPDMGDVPVVLP